MANKSLADWIKSEEAQGYSEKQLNDFLLKKGYSQKEIDGAISPSKKSPLSFSYKDVFRPSLLKCLIPALVFILVLISFFVNSAYLPGIGQDFCNLFNYNEEFRNLAEESRERTQENNANPEELIKLYQEEDALIDKMNLDGFFYPNLKPIISANLYFLVSKIYIFDPFFPTPCEEVVLKEIFINYGSCRYYISEENHACIQGHISEQEQSSDSSVVGAALFNDNLPTYKKISFGIMLLHNIILAALLYIIISLITYGRDMLVSQSNKNKLTINGVIVVLSIIPCLLIEGIYMWFLPLLVSVFIISSFIRSDKHNRIFLCILTVLLVISLIGGIFIVNYMIGESFSPIDYSNIQNRMEYKAFPCENTKVLSMEEKQGYNLDQTYLDEEWNVCDNPSCPEMCSDYCPQKQPRRFVMLRGDNPSCICHC